MRVLVVDDEQSVAQTVARGLDEAGIPADYALDGSEALTAAATGMPFDVVVLDVTLGGEIDGLTVCRRLRAQEHPAAILMLTARDTVADRIRGLDAGADDYLVKPFAFDELLARVRALGRRLQRVSPAPMNLERLTVDRGSRVVKIADTPLLLSRKEFDLLALLIENAGQTLTRSRIYEHVWGYEVDHSSNLLEVYIGRLRRQLGPESDSAATITTVRGVGYRLDGG